MKLSDGGLAVGAKVGKGVGSLVGCGVGCNVDKGVGCGVGLNVGRLVGLTVGRGVGVSVGRFVGLGVGGNVVSGVGLFVGRPLGGNADGLVSGSNGIAGGLVGSFTKIDPDMLGAGEVTGVTTIAEMGKATTAAFGAAFPPPTAAFGAALFVWRAESKSSCTIRNRNLSTFDLRNSRKANPAPCDVKKKVARIRNPVNWRIRASCRVRRRPSPPTAVS